MTVCRLFAAGATAAAAALVLAACSSSNTTMPSGTNTASTAASPVPSSSAPPASANPTPTPTTGAVALPWPPASVAPLSGAPELAQALDDADRTIVDPGSDATQVEQAGVHEQMLLQYLSRHSELDAEVLAALTPASRAAIGRHVDARNVARAHAAAQTTPAPTPTTLPAFTIVAPEPVDTLLASYHEAERLTGVPWYWLAAINVQETRTGRIVGVSSAGAVGPMQFLPSTWKDCCTGDPTVSRDAIVGAARFLTLHGAPGDMAGAVHHYNPNDAYVAAVTAFAENMRDQPARYAGYHAWQVFVSTTAGVVRLPVGYSHTQPIDAAGYIAEHPDDLAALPN